MDSPWFDFDNAQHRRNCPCRLFCFPYAGAGASVYRPWGKWLPEQVEMVAVQLPGRESRMEEPLMMSMEIITASLAEAMLPLLDRPFAFFGHSTGAMISFALARLLRQRGLPQPKLLMVSAQDGPQVKPAVQRHRLSDPDFIDVIRNCNGTPDVVLQNPDLLEFLLPQIRADGAIYETYTYQPQPPLDCRIAVFYGRDDPMVSRNGLAGWRGETNTSFHCYDGIPGGHFFLHEAEETLATHINQELADCFASQPQMQRT